LVSLIPSKGQMCSKFPIPSHSRWD